VDDSTDSYRKRRAEEIKLSVKQAGYDPKLIVLRRVKFLVELDAAHTRWRRLPTPELVKKAVSELVTLRKSEFASSAAREDRAADLMADARIKTDNQYSYNHLEAQEKSDAALSRVLDLSDLLRDQIKSRRVDMGALIREAPVVRPMLRMFGNP
jgi:hypothetical protein